MLLIVRVFLFTKSLSVSHNRYSMAILKRTFYDRVNEKDYLETRQSGESVIVEGKHEGKDVQYIFDKTTAIKFAKTIRTEINKVKEVNHV